MQTTMTFREASDRVKLCNHKIIPRLVNGNWQCDNCGIGLAKEKRNKCGFRHYFYSGPEKECKKCKEVKSISEFYYSSSALDKRKSACKECARDETLKNDRKLSAIGKCRRIWLPDDLWSAVDQVRGRQTFRDFIVISLRKEVERRAKEMYTQRILDSINSKNKK